MNALWLTTFLVFAVTWPTSADPPPHSPAPFEKGPFLDDDDLLAPALQRPQLIEIYRFENAGTGATALPAFTRSGRFLALGGEPVRFIDLDRHSFFELPTSGNVAPGGGEDELLVRRKTGLERWSLREKALLETRMSSPGIGLPAVSPDGAWLVSFGEHLAKDEILSLRGLGIREVGRTFGMTGHVLWHPGGQRFLIASHRSFCSRARGGELASIDTRGHIEWSRDLDEADRPIAWSFSPNGERLLMASPGALELRSGEHCELLRSRDVVVRDIGWLDERRALVLEDGVLSLWHPGTLTRVARLFETEAHAMVSSPKLRHLVLIGEKSLEIYTLLER
ncbi:MAG: hypothetical protein RL885_24135 [Planctomycetota bacterium]